MLTHKILCGVGSAEITCKAKSITTCRLDRCYSAVDRGLGPSIDDDPSAFSRQGSGDGIADSRRTPGHESELVCEFHIHEIVLTWQDRRRLKPSNGPKPQSPLPVIIPQAYSRFIARLVDWPGTRCAHALLGG